MREFMSDFGNRKIANLLKIGLLRLSFGIGILVILWQPADAIVWGEPDDANRYPYVGAVINGNYLCSGFLLSPRVFVTAAHCVVHAADLQLSVVFGQDLAAPDAISAGFPLAHPDFAGGAKGPDVAVIQLLTPVFRPHYGRLPGPGLLNHEAPARGALLNGAFTTVGYGRQYVLAEPEADGKRHVGNVLLAGRSDDGLYAEISPVSVSGGPCHGDSGGPVFYGDSDVAVAINSFILDQNCVGNSVVSRLDVQEVIDFINTFLRSGEQHNAIAQRNLGSRHDNVDIASEAAKKYRRANANTHDYAIAQRNLGSRHDNVDIASEAAKKYRSANAYIHDFRLDDDFARVLRGDRRSVYSNADLDRDLSLRRYELDEAATIFRFHF